VGGIGPSAVVHPSLGEIGVPAREMTETDIADAIAAFARAAGDAQALGFDGVEVHGAHGYLVDQFFWEHTNRRTDQYGGDVVARTRFASEVIAAVRRTVGPNYPICLRFSQFKLGDFTSRVTRTPDELGAWLRPLVDAGVDIFHCSQRRFDTPEFEGSSLNLAGWTKKLSGKSTITVGSIGLNSDFVETFGGRSPGAAGLERLLERLENDEFDLVAVGRALLGDPEWPAKVRAGRGREIETFEVAHLQRYPSVASPA
jgi:2,4-dienoyl-CoA reductase-like NADH-dependent reductase (Old Yellow Enzyme family)